jgi:hypothetical protein
MKENEWSEIVKSRLEPVSDLPVAVYHQSLTKTFHVSLTANWDTKFETESQSEPKRSVTVPNRCKV